MANEESLSYSSSHDVYLTKKDDLHAVSIRDWNRLKKVVSRCKYKINWWTNIASVCAGISGSALVSVLAIPFNSEKETLTRMILWFLVVAFLLIAIILYLAGRQKNQNINNSIDNINETIKEIEDTFYTPNKE